MTSTLDILKAKFIHRTDAFAVMCRNDYQNRDNYYDRVWQPLTDDLLAAHLDGIITLAVFPTKVEDQTVKWVCWDIDSGEDMDLARVKAICQRFGYDYVLEASGRDKGLHVWHFFDTPQPVSEIHKLKAECYTRGAIDFFPSRPKVINDFYCELPIKLPLGYHRKEKKFSYFLNDDREEISIQQAFGV